MAIPPRLLKPLFQRLRHRGGEQEAALQLMSRLTQREREVLSLLAEGAGNKVIAQALVLSPDTVRTYVQSVLRKLGVHSRLEAVAFVRTNGGRGELGRMGHQRATPGLERHG